MLFALIFTIVLALLCTIVESGRIAVITAKIDGITYTGIDSAFAGYASQLFEQYGVMFYWNENQKIEDEILNYVSDNCDVNKNRKLNVVDFYKISAQELSIDQIIYATDQSGEVFANQVTQYMDYKIIGQAAEALTNRLRDLEKSKEPEEVIDNIEDYKKEAEQLNDKVNNLREQVNVLMECFKQSDEKLLILKNIFIEVKSSYEAYGDGDGAEGGQTKEKELAGKFMTDYKQLSYNHQSFKVTLQNLYDQAKILYSEIEQLKDKISLEKTGTVKELEDNKINQIKEICGKYLDILKDSDKMLSEYDGNIDNKSISVYEDCIRSIENGYKEININLLNILGEKPESESGDSEGEHILESIDNIMSKDLLLLVLPKDKKVSKKAVGVSKLPTTTCRQQESNKAEKALTTNKVIDRVKYSQYLLTHFGNFTDIDNTAPLSYELEYLIGGSNNDKDNLTEVIKQLLLLRTGFNTIHIYKDDKKREEAYKSANAITGYLLNPAVTAVTQFIIIEGWAFCEAFIDVRDLLDGKKVSIIKTDQQWTSSLSNIMNILETIEGNMESNNKGDQGLDYKEYIRFLLYSKNSSQQYYRTMDLIQLDICANINSGFRMEQCVGSLEASIEYHADKLFTKFSFIHNEIDTSGDVYRMKSSMKYSY